MKGSRLYFAVIILFTVLVFLFELTAPKQFAWQPTYDKNDREPFGSYVFDDVLSSSIDDYQVINKTFYQIWEEDSNAVPKAFLLTENSFDFSETDINCMFKLLHVGNQIMICTDRYSYLLEDILHIDIEDTGYYGSFDYYLKSKGKHRNRDRDSIFSGTDTLHYEKIYEVYPFVHSATVNMGKWDKFYVKDTTCFDKNREDTITFDSIQTDSLYTAEWRPIVNDSTDTLVFDKQGHILAMRFHVGEGEMFIVTTPLMFTNFGILDEQNASYAFRLLSYMKGKPLVRIEAYGRHDEKPSTPLRYLLVTPPLRWAIYTTVLLILLFIVFTAKRRQRIIPVVETPPNRTLEFVRLISSLFYSRHDNAEILKTKYTVFCSDIKRKTGIDLLEDRQSDNLFTQLAEKIGMPEDEIKQLIKEFRMIPYQYDVPDGQLKELTDKMNKIKNQAGIRI
ncbi:MAG: hypothetical protein LBD80_03490 [Tannerella sp.]|jgi:hypothetical protein|nr:hypothetical protein [Tannerella sp.]